MRTLRILAGALTATAVGSTVALAAGMTVSTERLTVYTSTSQLPPRTCTITASADSWIDEGSTSANHGTGTSLYVQSSLISGDRRSLVRFDLSTCAGFSGSTVSSATLELTVTQPPLTIRTYNVHRATASWDESTVTWANQPAMASSATASASIALVSGVTQWTVTSDVQGFAAGTMTNHGWRVRDADENLGTAETTRFASRENSTTTNRPRLVVSYTP